VTADVLSGSVDNLGVSLTLFSRRPSTVSGTGVAEIGRGLEVQVDDRTSGAIPIPTKEARMLKRVVAMSVLALVAVVGLGSAAWAADVEGQVKSVDANGRMITLEDGTTLTIPPTTRVDKNALKPGAKVKASFEEKGADKVVTSIQVMPAK
jgi:Protein of unknown function (DUF1344)